MAVASADLEVNSNAIRSGAGVLLTRHACLHGDPEGSVT